MKIGLFFVCGGGGGSARSCGGWRGGAICVGCGVGDLEGGGRVVVGDGGGVKEERAIPDLNPSSVAGMRGVMEAVFYDTSWVNEDALRKIFTDKLAVHDGYTVRSFLGNPTREKERLDDRLGSIKVPTLVTWGKQDKLLPIASGERYAAGIAGAKMGSFEEGGHWPA